MVFRGSKHGLADAEDRVGVVTGLAWTQVGGELLNIEAVAVSARENRSL